MGITPYLNDVTQLQLTCQPIATLDLCSTAPQDGLGAQATSFVFGVCVGFVLRVFVFLRDSLLRGSVRVRWSFWEVCFVESTRRMVLCAQWSCRTFTRERLEPRTMQSSRCR